MEQTYRRIRKTTQMGGLNSGASKVLRRLSPSRLATLRVLAPLQ